MSRGLFECKARPRPAAPDGLDHAPHPGSAPSTRSGADGAATGADGSSARLTMTEYRALEAGELHMNCELYLRIVELCGVAEGVGSPQCPRIPVVPESSETLAAVRRGYVRLTDMPPILGVSKPRCHQLAQRDEFPRPTLIRGRRLW